MIDENKTRTIIRLVIWQCIALCITISILIIAMGDVNKALTYGIIDHVVCLVFHYFYDRVWLKFGWGIEKDNEKDKSEV